MDSQEIEVAIGKIIHPNVFTGVKPVLLVAEELLTEKKLGTIVEAVWVSLDSNEEFSYISKFAVSGKINLKKYYQSDEAEPFHGRVALVEEENLKHVVIHRKTLEEIKAVKAKRSTILDEIDRGFDNFLDLYTKTKEIYLFKKKDGDWEKEFFSNFDINTPYKVIKILETSPKLKLLLENTKTSKTLECDVEKKFYGFFIGSKAEIAGLKLKSESYLKSIEILESEARDVFQKIEWLNLDDFLVEDIATKLPKYPFEEYFNYVKKENVRKIDISDERVDTLKSIILEHMPDTNTPMGMEYISMDKLLYLFHEIIPRKEALIALELCDIVYEPPGILLGFEGKRQLAPKFLVPISHVASAYEQFPAFVETCTRFKNNN